MRDYFDGRYRDLRQEGAEGWVGPDHWEFHRTWLERALEAPHSPGGGRAIEIGSGAGNWCEVLAERGFQVSGIDLSPEAVTWARARARRLGLSVDYHVGRFPATNPWQSGAFDFVLDGFCLHFVPPDERRAFLEGVSRLLRPAGLFYIRTFVRPPGDESRARGEERKTLLPAPLIREELEDCGFRIALAEVAEFEPPLLQIHAVKANEK